METNDVKIEPLQVDELYLAKDFLKTIGDKLQGDQMQEYIDKKISEQKALKNEEN